MTDCFLVAGYAGTAVFSKTAPLRVKDEIVVGSHAAKGGAGVVQDVDTEGRFVALEFERLWVVHTYVPNAGGQLERLDFRTTQWDRAIERELLLLEKESGGKPVVWCGDLNVAHEEIDIHDPKGNRNKSAGFTDAERESFSRILASGFADSFRELHPEQQQFSYFSYRFNARARNKGWRLDYFVVSRALMPSVVRCRSMDEWTTGGGYDRLTTVCVCSIPMIAGRVVHPRRRRRQRPRSHRPRAQTVAWPPHTDTSTFKSVCGVGGTILMCTVMQHQCD